MTARSGDEASAMRFAAAAFAWLLLAAAAAPKSHVVGGVNFDKMKFAGSDPEITITLQSLFSGQVAGKTIAVALLHYELPATGYNEGTEVFEVSGGRATRLGSVGEIRVFR